MSYRLSRNVEASIIEYITTALVSDGWNGIRVEKSFSEVYEGELPCICINSPDRPVIRREIGTDTIFKDITVEVRIFAKSDGQRLDLSDWIIEKLISGIVYYEYTITNNVISKILKGRIQTIRITDRKELVNTENLEKYDKYRQIISLDCRVTLL